MSTEVFCPICNKDMSHYIGELPSCNHTTTDLVNHINALQAKLDEVIRSRDGWERDALVYAQNSAKYENERDALQAKLDAIVKEIRMPIDNPKSYGTELINWSKYLLAKIKKLEG